MSTLKHRPPLKKLILIAVTLSIWGFFLWRAISVLGPESSYVFFNSDGAIPILMANDERPITVFDAYYYGSDRWGAWPLLAARLIHHATNYRWSDQSIHSIRVIWLFLGILAMALLNRRAPLAVVIIWLIAACLHSIIRLRLFDLSQVYAWQITPLLIAWYGLRRLFGKDQEPSAQEAVGSQPVLWSAWVFFFSFLSIWSSFASGPFLLFLTGLEVLRRRMKTEKQRLNRWMTARYICGFGLVLAAIIFEVLMRVNYHRHGLKHYGNDFKTPIALDVGYLRTNLIIHLRMFSYFTWWPLILLAPLAILGFLVAYLYFSLKARRKLLKEMHDVFTNDDAILITGACGIAAINFVLIVTVNHVRLNFYDNRFSTLTMFFGAIGGLLTLFLMFRMIAKRTGTERFVVRALTVGLAVFLISAFPGKSYSPIYKTNKETALTLAQQTPNAVLMGGYWQTYLFVALQPSDPMIPLPFEGQHVRLPWTPAMMRQARQIVIEYRQSKFASAETVPQNLTQYGNSLRLIDPKWYENGEYAFALYVNETK